MICMIHDTTVSTTCFLGWICTTHRINCMIYDTVAHVFLLGWICTTQILHNLSQTSGEELDLLIDHDLSVRRVECMEPDDLDHDLSLRRVEYREPDDLDHDLSVRRVECMELDDLDHDLSVRRMYVGDARPTYHPVCKVG